MSNLEESIKAAAEKAVLKVIAEGGWIAPDYNNRWKLPPGFLAEVWGMVDTKKLQTQLARRLEAELADRIVNHMAAEIATDVKQILSVQERREALRSIAREHMAAIMSLGVAEAPR